MPSNTTLPPFRFLLFLLYDVGHVAVAESFKLEVFLHLLGLPVGEKQHELQGLAENTEPPHSAQRGWHQHLSVTIEYYY